MKLYIAAPFSWRDSIKEYATKLSVSGIEITSSWIEETVPVNVTLDQLDDEYHVATATTDVQDIDRSDVVAVFTIDPLGPPKPRGGRHWETGYAYGRGKEVIVIGPRENIFHYLPGIQQFDTKEEAAQYLHKRNLN